MSSVSDQKEALVVCGSVDTALTSRLSQQHAARLAAGKIPAHEREYVRRLNLLPTKLEDGSMKNIDPAHLERLKTLCQLWDVQLRPTTISSHRKVIGPIIIFAKKIITKLVQHVMKDSMRQQRDFNAGVISLLSDICSKK